MKYWQYLTYIILALVVIRLLFQTDGFYYNNERVYLAGLLQLIVFANIIFSVLGIIVNSVMKKEVLISIRIFGISVFAGLLVLLTSVICHGACGLSGEPIFGT